MKKGSRLLFVGVIAWGMAFAEVRGGVESATPYACPFPDLETKVLQKESGGFAPPAQISFVAKDSKKLWKVVASDPWDIQRVLMTKIDSEKPAQYYIDFDPGPSVDPSFRVVSVENGDILGEIAADYLIFPGNGFVYSYERSDRDFLQRRKYRIQEGKVVEVPQPFLYVGSEGRTLREIVLFDKKEGGGRVATVAKGEIVFVVLNDGAFYLVRTKSGLLGWVRLGEQEQKATWIEGLFFAGD